jgi:hypothetical protein
LEQFEADSKNAPSLFALLDQFEQERLYGLKGLNQLSGWRLIWEEKLLGGLSTARGQCFVDEITEDLGRLVGAGRFDDGLDLTDLIDIKDKGSYFFWRAFS